ncbi:histidinol-phosphatase (PHP family) [Exophiala aquamarina CBS 119918]|uniref:Histidinol-phosphatase n=1 Tax=Exophiala aquamarina CBS 119918 TaxID=1182545 RepID=A0A072PKA6_9EURO|nr:histidinol-phosphatase (PHP family) [Exophiala aquamarina CBS 119918]KEF59743.1 histidinol-phosphatase (PHP family) [Exophiala aquamarina CBS 119918]
MPFSHHSHSGQFCDGHARDSLEDIILTAISKEMQVFALTEHMPRHDVDRYPEEEETGVTLASSLNNEASYFKEAVRLREKLGGRIGLPIGFESDWIRPESLELIDRSIRTYAFDFFVGSVHHVHTIPIDYDYTFYKQAREKAGGTDEQLFQDYFDAQLAMLQATKPPVVGHFDLIRLKSDDPNASLKHLGGVWQRIERNLECIASYGAALELNFASLRKGLNEPYPQADICRVAVEKGVRFCLSDDSHGMDQVALNYSHCLSYLRSVGIGSLTVFDHSATSGNHPDTRFSTLRCDQISLLELEQHRFWKTGDN